MPTILFSILLVTFLTYSILPVSAQNQMNTRFPESSARQIAARSVPIDVVGNRMSYPQSSQSVEATAGYPAGAYAATPSAYSNGVSTSDNNSWSSLDNGTGNAYDYSSFAPNSATNTNIGGSVRIAPDYGMTNADVIAARAAILNGSFFRWHGTQSSRTSRNR